MKFVAKHVVVTWGMFSLTGSCFLAHLLPQPANGTALMEAHWCLSPRIKVAKI